MQFPVQPVDPAFNVAVKQLAMQTNPGGWDQVKTFDEAPTTLEAVLSYYADHGRLCIAEEDSDGTIYACADTNHHLRAWHDTLHVRYRFSFTASGEAAATYAMVGQLVALYGDSERTVRWAALLLADILGLVHYHQRTGEWPIDKLGFTVGCAEGWMAEAKALVAAVSEYDKEHMEFHAMLRSTSKWGNPWEVDVA